MAKDVPPEPEAKDKDLAVHSAAHVAHDAARHRLFHTLIYQARAFADDRREYIERKTNDSMNLHETTTIQDPTVPNVFYKTVSKNKKSRHI